VRGLLLVREALAFTLVRWLPRNFAETMVTLGLVPRSARKYLQLLFQRYTGDVTIVPAATIGDYMRILANPTNAFVDRCITIGMRQTWKKLSFIRARTAIELALDAGVRKLQRELAGHALQSAPSSHGLHDDSGIARSRSGGSSRTPVGAHVPTAALEARDLMTSPTHSGLPPVDQSRSRRLSLPIGSQG
jgi:hypothetical protein